MAIAHVQPLGRRSIIPGFGLTLGITLTYLSLIVIIPIVVRYVSVMPSVSPKPGMMLRRPRGCTCAIAMAAQLPGR